MLHYIIYYIMLHYMCCCVGFVHFILREVTDAFPQLLEQCNRRLIMLLTQWKTFAQANQAAKVVRNYLQSEIY